MAQLLVLLLLLVPTGALAQSPPEHKPADGPIMGSLRPYHDRVKDYLLRAAEQMPEAEYGFRPTSEVRTFGQLLGHIADTQNYMCSAAAGAERPTESEIEKTRTGRAELIMALRQSFELCDQALQQSDPQLLEPMRRSADDQPRLSILILNATHNSEHYGNIVTYMRMKGMVPPSSQPQN